MNDLNEIRRATRAQRYLTAENAQLMGLPEDLVEMMLSIPTRLVSIDQSGRFCGSGRLIYGSIDQQGLKAAGSCVVQFSGQMNGGKADVHSVAVEEL